MTPFIFTNGDDEDDDETLDSVQKFASCETSDECYSCTGRIILNLEFCRVEEAIDAHIADNEIIKLCVTCLQNMARPFLVGISYDPVDAFSWMEFEIVAFHPDSRN